MRLSYLQPSCVDFFAQFQWLVVGLVFTKVLSHHRVPVFHVGLAVPFFRTSVVHMLHLFSPAVCAALPMTSQTLVNEAEGCNTIKQFGVRVFIIKNNLQFANKSVEFGHRAACVWGFHCPVFGACASSANAVFPLWSDGPHLPVIDMRSEPNHVARGVGTSAPSTKNHDVFSVQLAGISHDQFESLSQCSDRMSM